MLSDAQIMEQVRDFNPAIAQIVERMELAGGFALEGGATCGIREKVVAGCLVLLVIALVLKFGIVGLLIKQIETLCVWIGGTGVYGTLASYASAAGAWVAGTAVALKDAAVMGAQRVGQGIGMLGKATGISSLVASTQAAAEQSLDALAKGDLGLKVTMPGANGFTTIPATASAWSKSTMEMVHSVYENTKQMTGEQIVRGASEFGMKESTWMTTFSAMLGLLSLSALGAMVNGFLQLLCDKVKGLFVSEEKIREQTAECIVVARSPEVAQLLERLPASAKVPAAARRTARRTARRSTARRESSESMMSAYMPRTPERVRAEPRAPPAPARMRSSMLEEEILSMTPKVKTRAASPRAPRKSPRRTKSKTPERKSKTPERKSKTPERKSKTPERKASPKRKAPGAPKKANHKTSPKRKTPERKTPPAPKKKSPKRK